MKVTIPREEELSQINLFNSCLTELPLRIKQLITGQEMQWLFPVFKKMLFVKQTDREMGSLETISQLPTGKDATVLFLQKLLLDRLGDEDLERMEEKWDELNDVQAFHQWFFKEYRQEVEDLIYNDCHGSLIELLRHAKDVFLELDFHTILWSEKLAKGCSEIVRKYREEYDAYLESVRDEGHYLYLYNKDDEEHNEKLLAFQIYYQLTEENFNNLFQLMQNRESQLPPEDYRLIYDRLREKGIDRYVQRRYDEYRSLMPGTADLRFFDFPQAGEVYKSLKKYMRSGMAETTCYFQELIDNVLPLLETRNQMAGFVHLLWCDNTHFDKRKTGRDYGGKYSSFQRVVAAAFHLPSLDGYREEQASKAAQRLMEQFPIFRE